MSVKEAVRIEWWHVQKIDLSELREELLSRVVVVVVVVVIMGVMMVAPPMARNDAFDPVGLCSWDR